MNFDIVINPAGGGGKAAQFWKSVEPEFEDVAYAVHYSSLDHGIREIVYELTSRGQEVNLVVVGGDGSMNEAVNGIADFSMVKLGFLSCGSANDLAKDVGTAPTVHEQVARIKQGTEVRRIDVGEVIMHDYADAGDERSRTVPEEHRFRFNISAGLGWDAEICFRVEQSPWKEKLNRIHLGKLIYIAEAIRTIFGMHPVACEVTAGELKQRFEQSVFCAVMNHRYEGGGFMFGPHAKHDDGILDLCVVNDVTVSSFFRMFPKAYKGTQFETRYAVELREPEFRFQTEKPVFVHTDGEVRGLSSDVTIHLLDEKLRLLF